MKNKFLQLFFSFIVILSGFSASAQTTVPALITSNQVWDISGSPYVINQNSYIGTGVSVIVMPGVEVKTTGSYKITIDGEFQARGKWDSVITISTVLLEFTNKSKDYDPSTGKGAYFNYCNISGDGSGSKSISVATTSLKVDNCNFTNSYFSIYLQNAYPYDTVTTNINNSKFYGYSMGYGYPISGSIMESKMTVTNCYFNTKGSIYTYGNIVFKNNTFNGLGRLESGYMFGVNEVSCNRFINMTEGVIMNIGSYNSKGSLKFNNNTIDSFGNSSSIYYAMLTITKPASNAPPFGKVEIKNNNFLYRKVNGPKVSISSYNYNVTKTDSLLMMNNYWGSNDSATIAGYIKDYNDDINIYGRIIFASFENVPITGCSYNTGCAKANFKYSIQQDSIVTFKDSSFGSKPYKVKWKFGDGNRNDSNKKTVTHGYTAPGTYLACLYVYDTADNFCDSMCSVIVIKNKTKCNASYYFAVDTTKPNYVYIVNTSKGINSKTKYYWTFGDGTGSSSTNPSHTYGASGKYQLCLTIFDTTVGCYSTFCDSLEINSSGKVLLVLNEKDVTGILNAKVFNALSVYPNPSNGRVTLNLSTNQTSLLRLDIMNAQGQILRTEYHRSEVGYNDILLDLSEYENGLYFISVHSTDFSKNLKIVLHK